MKGSFVAVVALFFVAEFAMSSALRKKHPQMELTQISPKSPKPVQGIGCQECMTFASTAIQYMVSLILNSVVMKSCDDLCDAVANKTGHESLGVICELLCAAVGIKEFISILQKEDLDPIYYCELLDVCKVNDNGDAKITEFSVQPTSGPQETDFDFTIVYQTENGTGPGMIDIDIITVDKVPALGSFFHDIQQPGTYQMGLKLRTEIDNDHCDQDPTCEKWLPGNYTIYLSVCNGECGSKHPHSQIYDTASTVFIITKD